MSTKKIYEIALDFENQCIKAGRKDEDDLENLNLIIPAKDLHYLLSIVLAPPKKDNLVWGDKNAEWPDNIPG